MALAALIVAIVGAATGIAALGWNVITWGRQGPVVSLDAWFLPTDKGSEIYGTVWNSGRSDAHIHHFRVMWTATGSDHEETSRANVPLKNVEMRPHGGPIPANGSAQFTIRDPDLIMGDLLATLDAGGKVILVARTGPHEEVSTTVRSRH